MPTCPAVVTAVAQIQQAAEGAAEDRPMHRYITLFDPVQHALESITGNSEPACARDWREWWAEYGEDFEIQER